MLNVTFILRDGHNVEVSYHSNGFNVYNVFKYCNKSIEDYLCRPIDKTQPNSYNLRHIDSIDALLYCDVTLMKQILRVLALTRFYTFTLEEFKTLDVKYNVSYHAIETPYFELLDIIRSGYTRVRNYKKEKEPSYVLGIKLYEGGSYDNYVMSDPYDGTIIFVQPKGYPNVELTTKNISWYETEQREILETQNPLPLDVEDSILEILNEYVECENVLYDHWPVALSYEDRVRYGYGPIDWFIINARIIRDKENLIQSEIDNRKNIESEAQDLEHELVLFNETVSEQKDRKCIKYRRVVEFHKFTIQYDNMIWLLNMTLQHKAFASIYDVQCVEASVFDEIAKRHEHIVDEYDSRIMISDFMKKKMKIKNLQYIFIH